METFHFLRPAWLLALLPSAWLVWQLFRHRHHANIWSQVCDAHLLPSLLLGRESKHQRWPLYALALAWFLGITALAGPTWSQLPQPLFRIAHTRVFVLDLSKSMDATDLKPSRIARARFKLLDMLKQSREGQSALIAFAGDAFTVTPLTDDTETIVSLVPTLIPDLMPSQGSRVDTGLKLAAEVLNQSGARHGEVIVLTDGAENPETARESASDLAKNGHRVHIVAVGSPQGGPIPVTGGGFMKDSKGAIVIPQVDYSLLQLIATAGAGQFTPLQTDDSDLRQVLVRPSRDATTQDENGNRRTAQWREEGPWLVLALLPFAAAAFRRGWLATFLLIPFLLPPSPAYAFEWQEWFARPDQLGARALEQGNPAAASELFQDPAWRASAHYRAGNYDAAAKEFATIDTAEGRYNYGNALAKLGRLPEALQAYNEVLADSPRHEDAKQNRDLVQKLLKDQQQKNQPQKNNKSNQNTSDSQKSEQEQSKSDPSNTQQSEQNQQTQSSDTNESASPPDATAEKKNDESEQKQSAEQSHDNSSANSNRKPNANPATEELADAEAKDASERKADKAQAEQHAADKKQSEASNQQLAATDAQGKLNEEKNQAMEQWLRRIDDDPGGLLRRKFIRDLQRQGRQLVPGQQAW